MSPAVQYLVISALLLHSFFCTKGECLLGFCADSRPCCCAESASEIFDASCRSSLSRFDLPRFDLPKGRPGETESSSFLPSLFLPEAHHHHAHHHGVCRCLESDPRSGNGLVLLLMLIGVCLLTAGDFCPDKAKSAFLRTEPRNWAKNRRIHLLLDRFLI